MTQRGTGTMPASDIALTPVAEAMLEQLSADEQRQVLASVAEISGTTDLSQLRMIRQSSGGPPFYVLRVSPKLRVFLSQNDKDHVVVLDVVKRSVAAPSPANGVSLKAANTRPDQTF